MTMQIKYKIVKIIDESTFMVNAGTTNDFKVGDYFNIIGDKTIDINDPETGELLEKLPTYKGKITIYKVFNKVSLCTTDWIEKHTQKPILQNRTALGAIINDSTMLKNVYREKEIPGHYQELPVNSEQMTTYDDHDDSPISLGDKVVFIPEESSEN